MVPCIIDALDQGRKASRVIALLAGQGPNHFPHLALHLSISRESLTLPLLSGQERGKEWNQVPSELTSVPVCAYSVGSVSWMTGSPLAVTMAWRSCSSIDAGMTRSVVYL